MTALSAALLQSYPGIRIDPFPDGENCVLMNEAIVYWGLPQPKPNEADVLAAFDPVADAKRLRAIVIRTEAAAAITAKWPLWAQNNCALGVYPDATVAQCAADIAAVIAASNTAEDAIEAATTVAEVEAVTATWPTL